MPLVSLPSALSYLAAATLAASALAVVQHASGDAGALALYGLGAVQGALLFALVTRGLYSSKSVSGLTSPVKAEATERDLSDATPRSLLKSVSAVSNAIVPASGSNVMLEVEFSVDDYESMRKRQRKQGTAPRSRSRKSKTTDADAASPVNATSPDSGVRRVRSSRKVKTPTKLLE